ncbi:hypothetical protein EV126DRAFT_121942 [Verticillium dahliae]|nr:hypothetical protein EV126DRAFT_121942 [Verticillium dahliae]
MFAVCIFSLLGSIIVRVCSKSWNHRVDLCCMSTHCIPARGEQIKPHSKSAKYRHHPERPLITEPSLDIVSRSNALGFHILDIGDTFSGKFTSIRLKLIYSIVERVKVSSPLEERSFFYSPLALVLAQQTSEVGAVSGFPAIWRSTRSKVFND